jgi:tetratricopeptide (TPR) repeat protein
MIAIETPLDKYLDRVKISEMDMAIEMIMEATCGFECFHDEAKLFLNNDNPIVAYRSIKKAMEFAKEKEQFMRGYKLIGEILDSVGFFEEALSFFEESLKLAEELKDIKNQINILNSIAGIYFRKEGAEKSLECYQKALQLYNSQKKPPEIEEIATIYNNIAVVYNKEKQYEKAIEYFKKAIELSTDPEKSSLYKLNLGHTYTKMKDFKNAEKCLLEAFESFKKMKNELGKAKSYKYFAIYHKEKGSLKKAMEYYQRTYKILNSIGKKYEAEEILEEIEELNKQTIS